MSLIHENIRIKLDYFYTHNTIPHLLFHGTSVTGKKTLVLDFINKIYDCDKQKIKKNVLFVNCSHGKGIKFIREELKFFTKANLQSNTGVKFKSVVLFNADSLTIDAQSALRRCIELFSYNTRFFIIVENKHRLLNPILSRFCDIYVPEYICDGKVVNLHQYAMKKKYDFSSFYEETRDWMKAYMDGLDHSDYSNLMNASIFIYENGYSAIDVMEYFENESGRTDGKWTKEQCAGFSISFHKIKSEFRCEKLLIFYILDMVFYPKSENLFVPTSVTHNCV